MAGRFLVERALHSALLMVAATLVVFVLLHLIPGDPAQVMLGQMATPQAVQELRQALGLNRPLPVQYGVYVDRLLHGDLGLSIQARRPVLDVVAERAPATLELAAAATVLAVGVGVPIGVLSALRRRAALQTTAFVLSLFGQAMPGYWLGLLLINVFSVQLGWLPVSGSGTPAHVVLPAVTLSAFMLGLIVRLTRSTVLEVMFEDCVRTARAKGVPERQVIVRHVLRLALIPVVTVIGLQVGTLLGGAVVTESIFAWPGIGSLAVLAIYQRDYPVVQALVLLSALAFLVINFMLDVLYAYLDPRIVYR